MITFSRVKEGVKAFHYRLPNSLSVRKKEAKYPPMPPSAALAASSAACAAVGIASIVSSRLYLARYSFEVSKAADAGPVAGTCYGWGVWAP